MSPKTDAPPRKPRLALLMATGFGLGYLPLAPGTWGSLLGVALAWSLRRHGAMSSFLHPANMQIGGLAADPLFLVNLIAIFGIALAGVWISGRVAEFTGHKDPQFVVIDEVSGQMIALLGAGWILMPSSDRIDAALPLVGLTAPNWKYLMLGFILFRGFDIWKPFPARQAERLPGGWGIMADDWVAGIYAALALWLARALGL
jgi:phosphatidylglycerophosphatase A